MAPNISKKSEQMLFILGEFLRELNKKFSSNILRIQISKAEFIDIIKKISIVNKQPRAIYKNLEELEKAKYLIYSGRNLKLSRKGIKAYESIRNDIDIYYSIVGILKSGKISFKRKTQSKLSKLK